jgi:hypothetical protein
MSDESIDYTVEGAGYYQFATETPKQRLVLTPKELFVAGELHRRARRIVDTVVAEAMEQITGKRQAEQPIIMDHFTR